MLWVQVKNNSHSIENNAYFILRSICFYIFSGGIKPCVSAFGGDQFKLPQQQSQLQTFFSMFYLSVNGGSLISTFFTPIFRKDIHCFGEDTCYSLAFGVPAILMAISTIILVIGNHTFGGYIHEPPQGSIVSQVLGSIWYAKKQPKNPGEIHWLDRAKGIYREDLIEDTKILLKMLALYLPLPVFWALLKQQGTFAIEYCIHIFGRKKYFIFVYF